MSMSSELAAAIEEPDLRLIPRQDELFTTITPAQRMLSACSGSIVTSLFVTPLDVVRVRLQQQELLLPSGTCCQSHVFWDSRPVASTSSTTCPTTGTSQCHTETTRAVRPLNGTASALVTIARTEGLPTLWRGLSITLLMAAPSNIVYFTGYELLRDSSPIKSYATINPLLCGAIARVFAGTVVAPLELLKTRLQSVPNNQSLLSSLVRDLANDVRSQGPQVLFRGLALTLWRDVPFSGVYWASYEYFKASFDKHLNVTKNPEWNLFIHAFLSGSLSGSIAALLTNPFDVGKTRLQISNQDRKSKNVVKFMSDIVKFEGFGALYVGFAPRILKVAPSCAIMISSYELGKRFFSKTSLTIGSSSSSGKLE